MRGDDPFLWVRASAIIFIKIWDPISSMVIRAFLTGLIPLSTNLAHVKQP
jgi:hypothetical protein